MNVDQDYSFICVNWTYLLKSIKENKNKNIYKTELIR
jgi:hypothetical protein